MLLTHVLRLLLARQVRPFSFLPAPGYIPRFPSPALGMYVHIPFCRKICRFCPYYKTAADIGKIRTFREALLAELRLAARAMVPEGTKRKITSLYFGGGSPAVMIDDLPIVRNRIGETFDLEGNSGIELHPRDIDPALPGKLRECGFDMVSLGVQSFSPSFQKILGRETFDCASSLNVLVAGGFKTVDVDLIFAVPGQRVEDLRNDFLTAAGLGATQISAYPFIDFSYTKNDRKPQGTAGKKKLLDALLRAADDAGFARTSVWTFGRKDTPRYSSVTRDAFIGFGPSAASLGDDAFKVNTFSVDAYIDSVSRGIVPTALRMPFSRRTRRLYWLFWKSYSGFISESAYRDFFGSELEDDFPGVLRAGERFGLLKGSGDGWSLTASGYYLFHRMEQLYTRQYIDKTWRCSMNNPWPRVISLY